MKIQPYGDRPMPIQDQNRSRKTYSFFRAAPVPLPSTADNDMIIVPNIGALSAHDASKLEPGQLAFVKSVRDYFTFERTVNSGSTDSIQAIQAAAFAGVWHRMGLGGPYWQNQLAWWVDSEAGNDENLGAHDVPLRSIDELSRRLLCVARLRNDYVVTLTSVTRSLDGRMGLDIELNGGSVTFRGTPRFSASLGGVTAMAGAVDYATADVPRVTLLGTGSVDGGPLYTSGSGGFDPVGWPLFVEGGTTFTTPFTGAVGGQAFQAAVPTIDTPGLAVRGRGSVVFNTVRVGRPGNTGLIISGDAAAQVGLVLAGLQSDRLELAGCRVVVDRSCLQSTSGSIAVHGGCELFGTGSGFVTPRERVIVRDAVIELGAGVIWNTGLIVQSSRLVMAAVGTSGSALASSSIEVCGDSIVDIANLISTRSIARTVSITGAPSVVLYDPDRPPKVGTVTVDCGHLQDLPTSQLPWFDLARQVRIVSGSLAATRVP